MRNYVACSAFCWYDDRDLLLSSETAAPVANSHQSHALYVWHALPLLEITLYAVCCCALQSGDWVVLLEGLGRISLQGLAARHSEAYDSVHVQPLELHSNSSSNGKPQQRSNGNGSGRGTASAGSPIGPKQPAAGAGMPGAAGVQQQGAGAADAPPAQQQQSAAPDDAGAGDAATVAELGAQLKRDTRLLLQLLSRQAGLPAARRLLELLEAVPPWRAADVVAAALARNSQVRQPQHCRRCTSSAPAGTCKHLHYHD
jgi:hypothetical protein